MHKLNIVYYESHMKRKLSISVAQHEGKDSFRPISFSAEAKYPIIPRPGDRVFFSLGVEYAKYFLKNQIEDDGKVRMMGEVKFIELDDGVEELYVHVTDPGCGAYGTPGE